MPALSTSGAAAKQAAWRTTLLEREATGGSGDCAVAELTAMIPMHNDAASERVSSAPGFVRCCLRAKNYDACKALALAAAYTRFRERSGWPVSVAATEAELRTGCHMLMPDTDALGQTVVTQRMSLFDMSLPGTSAERYQRAGYYLGLRALQRPASQLCGFALLVDFRGFSWSHCRALRVSDLRRGVAMLADGFPARLSAVYVVHQPAWLGALVSLLAPFLPRGVLQKKLYLLGADLDALHARIPASRLPACLDLGGTAELDWQGTVDAWAAEETARGAGDAFDPFVGGEPR